MHKLLLRILITPTSLAIWALLVIGLAMVTGAAHVDGLIHAFTDGVINADLALEDDIAVVLVAAGALLEERELFHRLSGASESGDADEVLNQLCERYGAYMLMLGLVMEMNDLCFEPLALRLGIGAYGIALMVILDGLAILLGAALFFRLIPTVRAGWALK